MKRNRAVSGARASAAQPSIRNFFSSTKQEDKGQNDELVKNAKRQKQGSGDSPCVIVLDDADEVDGAVGAVEHTTAATSTQQAPPAAVHQRALPNHRDAAAHGKAQAKLVAVRADDDAVGTQQQQQPVGARAAVRQAPAPKYTPLEQQIVVLKQQHPGVLLLVEVGYKMRMFGQDAEVAAKELGIYCYLDRNFMTASFPVPRLPIHVRRLVAAGHKVGVVRQTESAALKAAGDNRSAPFTRSLTGLFTAATLEAAEKADKLDEAGAMEASQGLEAMLGGTAASPAANYLLVLAQDMASTATQKPPAAAAAAGAGKAGSTAAAVAAAAAAGGPLGLVAVDAGSGDIAYGLASIDSSNAGVTSSSSSSSSKEAGGVMSLEAVLLSLSPSDIVVCEPVSAATQQVIKSYLAGASKSCRLERLQQQQQQPSRGQAAGSRAQPAAAAAAAGGYLDAKLMNDLVDFFGGGQGGAAAAAAAGVTGVDRAESSDPTLAAAAAAAAAAAEDAAGGEAVGQQGSLQFILSLPQPVLSALAGCLAYLRPFGLCGVLACTSSYRPLAVAGAMKLEGPALRQLEVMEAGADSRPQLAGSLLHLMDRCSTAAGGRVLRRWLAAPLATRTSILDRQQAVQVLLDSITGQQQQQQQQPGSSSSCNASVLQQLPQWLSTGRQDLERALARVAAGTAAPAEAVKLWTRLAELPKALQLPMQQQQPSAAAAAAGAETAAAAAAAAAVLPQPAAASLDLSLLSSSVPSRLLVSLLAAAAGPDVAGAAGDVLGRLDAAAAARNDYLQLFRSQQHFPEVFACRAAVAAAESHLQALLPQLASTAGVRSLSYVSIQNQGNYLVELPAARTDIPHGWQKVCATKKVCRYHPAEVQQGMAALARAQEQLQAACAAAWSQALRSFTAAHHAAFRAAVDAVAQLDALHALAVVASTPGYCRPQFVDESEPQQLCVVDGKHPMLDMALEGAAVPNSMDLTWDNTRAAVITGPNMGGKSVLIRQAALTIIMAQLGCWVPARRCVLSVFDGVYCRMGASDCLMLGRSTFAEELGEASHILAAATNRSFVIMDELGRGTATHDGVAIACATLSHLVCHTQCLSLFVTHYPEVAALASSSSSSRSLEHRPDDEQPGPASCDGTAAGAAAAAAAAMPAAGSGGGSSCDAPGQGAAGGLAGHVSVYHMSYVRQDSKGPQHAAAEAAAAAVASDSTGLEAAEAHPAAAGANAGAARPDSHAVGPAAATAAAAAAAGVDSSVVSPAAAAAAAAAAAGADSIPVITFLYKLAEGAADESFGLNVAQMAGLPSSVVQRAAVVARQLKARLDMQQQEQQMHHQQPGQQVSHGQASSPPPQQQQQQQDAGQLAAVPGLVAQAYEALKVLQQGDSQLSDTDFSRLQQLQHSAARVLAADGKQSS